MPKAKSEHRLSWRGRPLAFFKRFLDPAHAVAGTTHGPAQIGLGAMQSLAPGDHLEGFFDRDQSPVSHDVTDTIHDAVSSAVGKGSAARSGELRGVPQIPPSHLARVGCRQWATTSGIVQAQASHPLQDRHCSLTERPCRVLRGERPPICSQVRSRKLRRSRRVPSPAPRSHCCPEVRMDRRPAGRRVGPQPTS